MAPARRHIGASRRKRREDEGEEESSLAGEVEDDSLSEGSADSRQDEEDADGEGSESEDDTTTTAGVEKVNGGLANGRDLLQPRRRSSKSPGKPGLKTTVSDTEAMLNGLKVSGGEDVCSGEIEEGREIQPGRTPSAPPTEPKREPLTARKRREQEKFAREREQNPVLVPTRGSFFLHDKRTNEAGNGRTSNKGKSRPYGLIVDGNARRYGNSVISWSLPLANITLETFRSRMRVKGNGLMISMKQWPGMVRLPLRTMLPRQDSSPSQTSQPLRDLHHQTGRFRALHCWGMCLSMCFCRE